MRPELSGRSFIAFAGGDWWYHNRAHSDFQLLTRLARDHKVLLVNSIGMRMPVPGKTSQPFQKIWRKLKSVMRMLRQPVPGLPLLYVFSPLPFPLYRTATGRRFAAWFVRQQVRLAADWVGIRDPVIFLTPPTAWPVAKAMHAGSVVYNRSDKHSSFQEADRAYIQQLEQELLEGADLVLYASETLMQSEAARTRGRARHLDHGVEVELFRFDPPAREPQDLARIPKPRIGFFGGLRSFIVDFDLLAHVARSLPDAQLVLIGEAEDQTDRLVGIPNLHLLGHRDYERIPSYGMHFDVALLPYMNNEWIRCCNPIKLKEYLALGLSVVATEFPEAHRYEAHIRIAPDRDAFVAAVRACLEHPLDHEAREQRRALIADNTWDAATRRLLDLLAETEGRDETRGGSSPGPL